jgi:hypothetical protein
VYGRGEKTDIGRNRVEKLFLNLTQYSIQKSQITPNFAKDSS